MDNKLYVGNLSYATTEQDLSALFGQAGSVSSVVIIKDRNSGRSKGFGFVEMSTQVEAEEAIRSFNGYEMEGRQLKVSVARPKEEGGAGRRTGGYGGGGQGRGRDDQRRGGRQGDRGGNRSGRGREAGRYRDSRDEE